jgi:hypothetical protein
MVAIIDDNARQRERLADFVKSRSFEPLVFEQQLGSIEMTVMEARERGASYAVCDHRLFEGNYARFFGAQAVAAFYDARVAPVLVTGWENDDVETSIRLYRQKIPSLLHSKDASPQRLELELEKSGREVIEGVVAVEREPCPAILSVTDILRRGGEAVVRAIVSQWHPTEEVGFPLAMVPQGLREAAQPGRFLYADVNVDATSAEDLFFVNFSLPNEKDVEAAFT